jgi:hypothetical protein
MKIRGDEYEAIRTACFDTLKAHNLHPFMVNTKLDAWNVFHKACAERRLNCNALYKTYNDSHIETALKAIFKH